MLLLPWCCYAIASVFWYRYVVARISSIVWCCYAVGSVIMVAFTRVVARV